ncbi:HlyD family secretion protein, partial [Rhizobium lusitanum]|nr:HlyD family secretion protein [Rhizobium lusitanum]
MVELPRKDAFETSAKADGKIRETPSVAAQEIALAVPAKVETSVLKRSLLIAALVAVVGVGG